jgi:DNA-binding transcriptional ArsR family regulator
MRHSASSAVTCIPDGFEPDFAPLQSLIGNEPGWGQYTGIKGLMLAVLEEGIGIYLGPRARQQSEAAAWIASGSRQSPFTFCVVCETLGLSPSAVRIALRRMREQNIAARDVIGRSRPNVRHTGRGLK